MDLDNLYAFVMRTAHEQGWNDTVVINILCRFLEMRDLKDDAAHMIKTLVAVEHAMETE